MGSFNFIYLLQIKHHLIVISLSTNFGRDKNSDIL